MLFMDEVSKYRLTGAAIWLLLLVVVVPGWYSHPVNFQPLGHQVDLIKGERPLVEHVYELPVQTQQKQAEVQTAPVANQQAVKTPALNSSPSAVDKAADVTSRQKVDKVASEKKSESVKPVNIDKPTPPQWIVKVTAYKDIRKANHLLGRLESSYEVWIKEFSRSGTYSVRTGPYFSKAKAEQDKQKLDKMLRTNAEVVQLN